MAIRYYKAKGILRTGDDQLITHSVKVITHSVEAEKYSVHSESKFISCVHSLLDQVVVKCETSLKPWRIQDIGNTFKMLDFPCRFPVGTGITTPGSV